MDVDAAEIKLFIYSLIY